MNNLLKTITVNLFIIIVAALILTFGILYGINCLELQQLEKEKFKIEIRNLHNKK